MKMKEDDKPLFNGEFPAFVDPADLTEMTFSAVITVDLQGRVTFWNTAAEEIYGLKAQQALGRTLTDLFKPMLTLPGRQTQILEQEKLDLGAILTGQYKFRLDKGSFLWVEYRSRAILTETGEICGYLVLHHDITARKLLEADMALLARMQAENPNPVMRLTPDGEVVYVNDAGRPLLDSWKRLKRQKLPRVVLNGIRKAFESGVSKELEIRFGSKTLNCTLAPIREAGYVNFYASDITKSKRAEKALKLARTRAEQARERMVRLQKVTMALSEAITPAQVAQVIIEQGIPTSNARTGSIMTLSDDGNMLEMLYTSSSEKVVRAFRKFPISSNVPAAEALRSGQPVWIKSQQDYKDRYPHLTEQIKEWGLQAAVAVPLIINDRRFGVLTLSFTHVQEFKSEDRDFIQTLAQQTAQALDRTRLFQKVAQALSELQMTYDQSPIGMIQLDTDLRYIRINETLARYNGISASDHIGRTIHEIVPDLAPKVEEGFRKVIETGVAVHDVEVIAETGADLGVPHTWLESWFPLRDESGQIRGLNVVVQDVSQRKRDEQALREYARQQTALYTLTDQLHRRNTTIGMYNAALDAILDALQCERASILLFDEGGAMRFVAWRGLSESYRKATDGHSPWKPDEMNAQPIAYDDIHTAKLDDELKAVIVAEGIGSLAFIPLVYEEKLIGKFTVYFSRLHVFNDKEVELSLTIARQIAFAIERKRAEQELRASEERFSRFMQHLPGLAWIKDTQGRYVYANAAAEKAFSVEHKELHGRTDREIFPEETAAQFQQHDSEVLAQGKALQFTETLEQDDGILHYSLVSKFPIPGPDGNTALIGGTALDITERKQMEDALRASEERFHLMADAAPVLIWISDTDKLCTWFNKQWLDYVGRPMDKELGNGWTENVHPDDFDRCLQTYKTSFDDRQPFHMEYRLRRHDEEYRWVLDNGIPLYGTNGEFSGFIGSCMDIHDRKVWEKDLRESKQQLQEFNETLERKVQAQTAEIRSLASDLTKAEQHERNRVSHILHDDLQQRLYAAKIHVTSLRDGLQEGVGVSMSEELAEIREQLDGAVTLARNLSIELSPPILQGEGLAQAIEWLASHMKESYGLKIEVITKDAFAIPDEDVQVLLFNCVRELLFNIVKHADTDQASVRLERVDSHIQIEVRDHGKGFQPSGSPGHGDHKIGAEEKGRKGGFGLPTIRHQLNLFGGQLDVRSEPEGGTHVTIMMPIEYINGQ